MIKIFSAIVVSLIIGFKVMAYEEANYKVVKQNKVYEIKELNLNKIILTWSISTNGGNIDGFHIYQNNDSNPIAMVNSDTFTYTTDELTSNTEYTFYVTSYTNDTESTPSTTIEYCTP